MEIIRRKILLETSRFRGTGTTTNQCDVREETTIGSDGKPVVNYTTNTSETFTNGGMTACTFNIPIFLTQKFDDMGMFTDMAFVQTSPLLTTPPDDFIGVGRPTGITIGMYYGDETTVTGTTDDGNLVEVQSYIINPIDGSPGFSTGINMAEDIEFTFDGVDSISSNVVNYTLGANPNDVTDTGIHYTTYWGEYVDNIDPETGDNNRYNRTTLNYKTSGRTEFNTSLSALTKEEEFLGIVFPQEVRNEVFIERGGEDIFEKHMVMAEIKTVNDVDEYRNGYLINKNV